MTNVITEVRVNVAHFIKKYYNRGNRELINKYKYIIMLGLTLEELKEFNRKYGDDLVNEYTEKMEDVLSNEEIIPLFTREEEKQIEINMARSEGFEDGEKSGLKRGEARGESNGRKAEKREIALKMLKEKIPIATISSVTGLSEKKLMTL